MEKFEFKVTTLKIQKSHPLKLFTTYDAFIKCLRLASILKCVWVYIFSQNSSRSLTFPLE